MKNIRIISTFFIILFVFIGNIGMNVFIHSCDEDGTVLSYIVKAEDSCSEEADEACCNEDQVTDDCCNDEVKIYQVKFDYFQSHDLPSIAAFIVPEVPFFHFTRSIPSKVHSLAFSTRPPPKPGGRQLLVLNQVFRI